MPGATASSSCARGAARHAALAVGLVALGADGVEVEQVGGGLRHQPDQRPRRRAATSVPGRRRRRSRARPRRRGPHALQGPEQRGLAAPVAAHTAVTSPACRSRSTPATASTSPGTARRRPRARAEATEAGAARTVGARPGGGVSRPAARAAGPQGAPAARVAHRQGQRRPPGSRPSSTTGGAMSLSTIRSDGSARATPRRRRHVHDGVGVVQHPLDPVLGHARR